MASLLGNNYLPTEYHHDHDTGKARGWLCNKCNSALGWFNDNKWQYEYTPHL